MEQKPQAPQAPEREYLFIDRKSPEILSLIENAPIYKKHGLVHARLAVPGEIVSTVLASGLVETPENIAEPGDWVVTNPDGEEYIVDKATFLSRNIKTENDGEYLAVGYCKAIQNIYGKPIEILASWGRPEYGGDDCYLADTCDASGALMHGEPYIIEHQAFKDTYLPVES